MADTIEDAIQTDATSPAEVRTEAGTVKQRPLKELIEADLYLEARRALRDANRKTFGIRFGRIVPPGAI